MSKRSSTYKPKGAHSSPEGHNSGSAQVKELEQALIHAKAQLAATAQKNNDLALQLKTAEEENSALRRIIHQNPTVTFSWRVRKGWPVAFVSENVRRFGYTPDDFYFGRLTYADIIHPEDRDQINSMLFGDWRNFRDEKCRLTYRIIRADQREAWIQHHAWLMRTPDDQTPHLVGALLEITEQKSAEVALTESESKFRNLTEESLVGVYIIQAGRFKYVNPKFAEMFGYRPDEIMGKIRPDEFILPEDREMVAENIQKRISGEIGSMHYEFRGLTRDKRIINVEVFGSRTQVNMEPAVIGSILDITARKQAEKNLRLTQYAVDHSATAIFRVDPDARIAYANQAASHLLGYTEQELMAMTIPDIDPRWTKEFWDRQGLPMLRLNRVNRFESEHVRKDGKRYPVEVVCYLAEYEETEQYYAFFTDISERKKSEAEIRKHREHLEELVQERTWELTVAKEQAEVANRAKSEFLANMSHEIRTPLNGVTGMLGLLRDTDLTTEQRDFAETAASSATALLNVINDILDFSKIEAGKLDFEYIDFDLREMVEDLTEMLNLQALDKGLDIACFVDPRTPKQLTGDPWRLRQVLLNLATNALKFTAKGEINIKAIVKTQSTDEVEMTFSVADTGIGIPETLSSQLFKPFSQGDSSTTRRFGGTGLGLVICKKLVDLMGGRIEMVSRPEQGSTFRFTARLGRPALAHEGADERESDGFFNSKRILVVEAGAASRDILETYLKAYGCDVRLASGGTEALSAMVRSAEAKQPFDIVLVDADPASMGAYALGESIRAHPRLQTASLVMLTDRSRGKDQASARQAGFDAVAYKPVKWSALKDTLGAVLGRRAHEPLPVDAIEDSQASVSAGDPMLGRILLAEDNPTNRKLALHILKKLGYAVDAVTDGRSALNALARCHYDLILMDVQMPEMDGLEATRSIRIREQEARHIVTPASLHSPKIPDAPIAHTPDRPTAPRCPQRRIPIIAMTAHAMSGDREKCLSAGMDDYITKPVDPGLMAAKLEYWLRGSLNGE